MLSLRHHHLFRSFLYSAWLPISVLVVALVRFGFDSGVNGNNPLFAIVHLIGLFVFVWPSGMFLTIAIQKILRRSKITAILAAILLAPITVWAATIGGLFGPIGIFAYTAVVSLPAWITLSILYLIQRKKNQ